MASASGTWSQPAPRQRRLRLLKAKLGDLKQGIEPEATYTVAKCVSDYLEYEPGHHGQHQETERIRGSAPA